MDIYKILSKVIKGKKIMKISRNGINLIKHFEGFSAIPYLDAVGVPTIGYGNTFYEDGRKVTMKDPKISLERGTELLYLIVKDFEKGVNNSVKKDLTQNQFDALVSFSYNLGNTAFKNSTLLKKINNNPNDPTIANEFARWNKAGGKVLSGLTRRRKAESDLYFKK